MRRSSRAVAALVVALAVTGCVDATPTTLLKPTLQAPVAFALETSESLSQDELSALQEAFDKLDEIRIRLFRDGATEPFIDTLIAVTPGQATYIIELMVETQDPTASEVLQVALTGSGGGVELFSATGQLSIRAGDAGAGLDSNSGAGPVVTLGARYTGPGLRGQIVSADGSPAVAIPVSLLKDDQVVATTSTTATGDYLFTDIQPGVYVVRVQPPTGLVSCPADRTIGPLTDESSVVGGFRLSVGDCVLRVLVLSGGDVDDTGGVVSALGGALPNAAFGTSFMVVNPPSLATLIPYDVVLLFENGGFADATLLGDRVAAYVQAGGNLVIGSFYWQNRSDSGAGYPGWGALEAIDPFTSTGGAIYGPGSLGSVTAHPITSGVSSISVARWWGGVGAGGGTSVVASWQDGTPLAGHKTLAGGQRLVGISAFPGAMSGDLTTLYANAVDWAGAAGGPAATSSSMAALRNAPGG